jgi:hypothetical protein
MFNVQLSKSELIILQDLLSKEKTKLADNDPGNEFNLVKEMNEEFKTLIRS